MTGPEERKMRKFASVFSCAVVLGTASSSWAALGVVFSEDFEGYANTAEMSAVWLGSNGELHDTLDYDLDGTPNEVNKTAYHPGGSINTYNLAAPIQATATEWIRLSVDIFDDDTSLDPYLPLNPWNKRLSLGLRSNMPNVNIIELGIFNALPNSHFAHRAILFDSVNGTPNPNWGGWDLGTEIADYGNPPVPTELPVNRFRGAGWHQLIVTIKPESLVFEIDMFRDGTIDGTSEYFDIRQIESGFNQLRFGGPSGISSGGGGVHFDNIMLEVIAPEPATLGLMAAGALALLKRRSA